VVTAFLTRSENITEGFKRLSYQAALTEGSTSNSRDTLLKLCKVHLAITCYRESQSKEALC
jgi:hypothetical protein